MAKNNKQVAENYNEDAENKNIQPAKKKETIADKIRHKLIMLSVIIGICGVAYLAIKSSLNNHSAVQNDVNVINSLTKRVSLLETKVAELRIAVNAPQDTGLSAAELEQKMDALKSEIKQTVAADLQNLSAQEKENAEIGLSTATKVSEAKLPQEMLLANGAIMVRDLAEKGLPFTYEAEVLQILAQGNLPAEEYVKTVQKYAASGVRGKSNLIAAFNRFYASLNSPKCATLKEEKVSQEPEPQTWDEKLWVWIKKLIIRKKKKPLPVFLPENDVVYETVNDGKLAEALASIRTDAKYTEISSPFLEQWQAQVQSYLDFEKAISGLIMNSLAHIRLKEMEHHQD
ncbi:MAG: hypothetical protein IJ778_04725 [Alphaproteobacteria bacterium]|nr:hypothetical protein [Alphaproteobacteria bacterium]